MKPEEKSMGQPEDPLVAAVRGDKNLMPSMVVRQQQQFKMGMSANEKGPGIAKRSSDAAKTRTQGQLPSCLTNLGQLKVAGELGEVGQQQAQSQPSDHSGLVLPRRLLPPHPVSVAQPIIRDLNRELKFNQIRGKNVLDQKSELKKALEKLNETKRKREAEQERLNRRTSLELRLEERAERIAKETSSQADQPTTCNSLGNFSIKSITR